MIPLICRQGMRVAYVVVASLLISLTVIILNRDRPHHNAQHWDVEEITTQQLQTTVGNRVFVDARSRSEFDVSHIPNALSLSLEDWDHSLISFLDAWTPDCTVVVYCGAQSCGLSKEVTLRLLKDIPDAKIFILKGGLLAWEQQYPSQI